MAREYTRRGAIELGNLVKESLDREGWTYLDLIDRLDKLGCNATESTISRLVLGSNQKPDALLLLSIADLKFIKKENGDPYSLKELMLVACEEVGNGIR